MEKFVLFKETIRTKWYVNKLGQIGKYTKSTGFVIVEQCDYGSGYLRAGNMNVHEIVATTFISNLDNKEMINHKDGNKHNNNVNNLEWVTRSENAIHAYRTGLYEKNKIKSVKKKTLSKEEKSKNLSEKQKVNITVVFKGKRYDFKGRKVAIEYFVKNYGINIARSIYANYDKSKMVGKDKSDFEFIGYTINFLAD